MVVDKLDELLEGNAGCRTVAFADLSTQMVLVTNTLSTLPREKLDRICAQAATLLGVDGKPTLGVASVTVALAADKSSVHLFLRATDEPNDVLCCVCSPDVDVEVLTTQAKACLQRISASHG